MMAIELETYTIGCPDCAKDIEFTVGQVECLARDIDDECDEAAKIARAETEAEFDGMVDPADLPIHPRVIHDLSRAIASGDLIEARILLDRIAYDLGGEHSTACEVGRFAKVPV
jgi:hypothetical protein